MTDNTDLPEVTDEMLQEALDRTEGRVMSPEERRAQLISFVWGNDLESDSTIEDVCRHLGL